MNVLLTSAGRRTYMVAYFKEAVMPYGGLVHAVNSHIDSPALWLADRAAQAPLIYDAGYKDFLLQYCIKNKIDLVVPLFDIDLPVLAGHKAEFLQLGINVVVADEWVTTMANDKWKTQLFLKEHQFDTVSTFLSLKEFERAVADNQVKFPVYVKPRWGMGSILVYKAQNLSETVFYFEKVKQDVLTSYLKYESENDVENAVIIQEALPGEEYGLDIINDLNGKYCTSVVKKKLAMRSGETDAAVTIEVSELQQLGKQLAQHTKHPGNMDADVFWDGSKAFVLELNPRFGGGYPFSHAAGINLPQALVQWCLGKEVDINKLLTPQIGVKSIKGIDIITQKNNL